MTMSAEGATPSASGSGAAGPDNDSGVDYLQFYQGLVEGQDARKTSIEQRGISVITTSGALVTLLFGIVTLVSEQPDYQLPLAAYPPLALALVAFIVAAVLGLLTNAPSTKYSNVDGDHLEKLLGYFEDDPPAKARRRLAATDLRVFKAAQEANEGKAKLLQGAMIAEVVAVLALAVGVSAVLVALT